MSPAISAIATLTCSGTFTASSSGVSRAVFWYFFTAVPCRCVVVLGGTPNSYREAGLRRGTATSTSTSPGTASAEHTNGVLAVIEDDPRRAPSGVVETASLAAVVVLQHDGLRLPAARSLGLAGLHQTEHWAARFDDADEGLSGSTEDRQHGCCPLRRVPPVP